MSNSSADSASASNPGRATTTAEAATLVEKVRRVASIHREIFHAYLEQVVHDPVTKISSKRAKPPKQLITYKFTTESKPKGKAGRDGVPPDTSPDLYCSFMKFECCDYATQTFIKSLQWQLDQCIPGALVEWILVENVDRRVKFQEFNGKVVSSRHSAFLLTIPHADSHLEFIVDFTIEQFGYSGGHWFLPKKEYLDRVTDAGDCKVVDIKEQHDFIERDVGWDAYGLKLQERMRKVCEELHWDDVKSMTPDVRLRYLYMLYSYSEHLVAGQMTMDALHKLSLESLDDAKPCFPVDDQSLYTATDF